MSAIAYQFDIETFAANDNASPFRLCATGNFVKRGKTIKLILQLITCPRNWKGPDVFAKLDKDMAAELKTKYGCK